MSKPNDGNFWYIPSSAREAVRCCAKTDEVIELFVLKGFPPSVQVMFQARLQTIDE